MEPSTPPSVPPERDFPPFPSLPRLRHILVLLAFGLLAVAIYGGSLRAPFQFDDIPNIVEPPGVRMEEITPESLRNAVLEVHAKNRVVVSLSFAFNYWLSSFLPAIQGDPPPPALVPWQFRLTNVLIHVAAGMAVYWLFLRLLQLPCAGPRLRRLAWPLAAGIAFLWFASPVQTQAVTYIVQRAASLAGLFSAIAIAAYLEARFAPTTRSRIRYFALMTAAAVLAVFSKECAAALVIAVPLTEVLVAGGGRTRTSRRWLAGAFAATFLAAALAAGWAYGRSRLFPEAGPGATATAPASGNLWHDIAGRAFLDEPLTTKVKLSPRQRLLTEARVVLMYESLLVWPAPGRLRLDYDFLESTGLWNAEETDSWRAFVPLAWVLGVFLVVWLTPPKRRALAFVLAILAAGAVGLGGEGVQSFSLAAAWRLPWPVPALVWHFLCLGFAAFWAHRRPFLAWGIAMYYVGHIVESTVLTLETVYEHRLYWPSAGFYFAAGLILYEAFYPGTTAPDSEEAACTKTAPSPS